MSTGMSNLDIDDEIDLNGTKYRVIATDTVSQPHPAGHKKWDYILQDEKGNRKDVMIKDLRNAVILKQGALPNVSN